eukprot:Skav211664  [mRNA]  locus=scaffold216:13664:15528:+ [translate_table: standard]
MNRIARIAGHVTSTAGENMSLGAQPTAGYCAAEKGEDQGGVGHDTKLVLLATFGMTGIVMLKRFQTAMTCKSTVWAQHGHSMGTAWAQHGHSMGTAWAQHGIIGSCHGCHGTTATAIQAGELVQDDVVICCAVRTALCKARKGSFKDCHCIQADIRMLLQHFCVWRYLTYPMLLGRCLRRSSDMVVPGLGGSTQTV